MKKGAFIKSVIENENFREIREQNEKKKLEILTTKSKELNNFLMDDRIRLIEEALQTKEVFDTFKSYYNENEDLILEFKRTWVNSPIELYDDTVINKRSVTTIEFNSKSTDILLASYSPEYGVRDSNEPNGLMIIHNLVRKKPELIIKHQTEITSCCFQQNNPKHIIAGTYTGQILIYDIRVGGTPVLKSPSATKQQSLPIYSISNYGLENSNQILSISNDGLVCVFNISNFSKPLKKIELKKGIENRFSSGVTMEEIGVICAANNPVSEYLYVGSDDSCVYQIFLGQV